MLATRNTQGINQPGSSALASLEPEQLEEFYDFLDFCRDLDRTSTINTGLFTSVGSMGFVYWLSTFIGGPFLSVAMLLAFGGNLSIFFDVWLVAKGEYDDMVLAKAISRFSAGRDPKEWVAQQIASGDAKGYLAMITNQHQKESNFDKMLRESNQADPKYLGPAEETEVVYYEEETQQGDDREPYEYEPEELGIPRQPQAVEEPVEVPATVLPVNAAPTVIENTIPEAPVELPKPEQFAGVSVPAETPPTSPDKPEDFLDTLKGIEGTKSRAKLVVDELERSGVGIRRLLAPGVFLLHGRSQSGKTTLAHIVAILRIALDHTGVYLSMSDKCPDVRYEISNTDPEDYQMMVDHATTAIATAEEGFLKTSFFTFDESWLAANSESLLGKPNVDFNNLWKAIGIRLNKTRGTVLLISQENSAKALGINTGEKDFRDSVLMVEAIHTEDAEYNIVPTGRYKFTGSTGEAMWILPDWLTDDPVGLLLSVFPEVEGEPVSTVQQLRDEQEPEVEAEETFVEESPYSDLFELLIQVLQDKDKYNKQGRKSKTSIIQTVSSVKRKRLRENYAEVMEDFANHTPGFGFDSQTNHAWSVQVQNEITGDV